jgi:hypothetical protein
MDKKILTLSLVCAALVLFAPLADAAPSDVLTVWTDKHNYVAGQTGTLYITYNNIRDTPVTVRNITVVFEEWWAYINSAWVGNLTYEPSASDKTISEHSVHVFEISFTVPSDGRAKDTAVNVRVNTNLPSPDAPSELPMIYVAETPVYMDQIVTLFTIQVVLLIVCTIIIAATIFLSARRPQVTWRAAEKEE